MDYLSISPGIEEYTQSQFLINLRKTIEKYPNTNFTDALSRNQVKSKTWLIDNMITTFGNTHENIFILCGWYGFLAAMINDRNIKYDKIRTIDIDPSCEKISDSINFDQFKNKWKCKAFTANILNLNYNKITVTSGTKKICEVPSLVINTSCEHIEEFETWRSKLPKGLKVILQSNNFDLHAQHSNCSESLSEFINQCSLSTVLFENTLDCDLYERYMVIGIT